MKFRPKGDAPTKRCPVQGCDSLPWHTDEEVEEHIVYGDHAFPRVPKGREVPARPEQIAEVRALLSERAGHPVAEGLRNHLNRERQRAGLHENTVDSVIAALRTIPTQVDTATAGHST